jgi:hypothetical protein
MLKAHMAACLVATALLAAPAFAQSTGAPSGATDRPAAVGSGSTTSGSSAMQPSAGGTTSGAPASSGSAPARSAAPSGNSAGGSSGSPPASSPNAAPGIHAQTGGAGSPGTSANASSAAAPAGAAAGHFITQQQPGSWLASKLIGTTVASANNESIGDVNDVLMDRNGQALAVIVGVGGFLGIGEKDVAVAFNELEFAARPGTNAGTTGSLGGTARTAPASDAVAPERIVLRMTKQDLQNAPRFAHADRPDAAIGSAASRAGTGSAGTAPAAPGGSTAAPK